MDFNNIPEWTPFACLITGRAMRKPMVTRVAESVFLGLISGGLSLYVGVKILERDFLNEKQRLDTHLLRYEAQIARRDNELRAAKADGEKVDSEIIRRLSSIEECLRARSCTK
jgi:hypothetical protein